MGKTKIEWTDHTINPVVGCTKLSEGCRMCYAEKMAWRLKCMGIPKYQDVVDENGWTGKIGVDMSELNKLPKKPKKIFISSMGDLFHDNVEWNDIYDISKRFVLYPEHTFILLTKRPANMGKKLKDVFFHLKRNYNSMVRFPLKNLWLGLTCENQKRYNERWPILAEIPAVVKFVSIEPALEYVDIGTFKTRPDWTIWGPETGPGKRPCDSEWAKKTYELCKANNIPFLDKTKKNWIAREFPKETTDKQTKLFAG